MSSKIKNIHEFYEKQPPESIFEMLPPVYNRMKPRDFVEKWYELGSSFKNETKEAKENRLFHPVEASTDDMFRFMAYWIAITHLLEVMYKGKTNANGKELSEREKIDAFCNPNSYVEFALDKYYKAFEDKENIKIFNKKIVKIVNESKMCHHDPGIDHEGIKNKKICCLWQAIYTVRCNLVHGGKELSDTRDRDLIISAANILEGYLKAIFANEKYYAEYRKPHQEEIETGY